MTRRARVANLSHNPTLPPRWTASGFSAARSEARFRPVSRSSDGQSKRGVDGITDPPHPCPGLPSRPWRSQLPRDVPRRQIRCRSFRISKKAELLAIVPIEPRLYSWYGQIREPSLSGILARRLRSWNNRQYTITVVAYTATYASRLLEAAGDATHLNVVVKLGVAAPLPRASR